MIIPISIIEDTMRRAARSGFEPEKYSVQIRDRDRARFVTAEQKRVRLAELMSETDLQEARRVLERQIGGNDLVSINYLARGLIAARPICRIHLRNSSGDTVGFATGFLVAPGVIMTNHHVLPHPDEVANSFAEFDYELDSYGRAKPTAEFALRADQGLLTVERLDFCLVAVHSTSRDGNRSLADYGWLKLDPIPGKAFVGEYLTIIQHPDGERKQVCVRENKLLKLDESGSTLWYQADPIGGSSGSPVFNTSWQVVALHHSGVPRTDADGNWLALDGSRWDQSMGDAKIWWIANEGIRISRILAYLRTECADDPLAQAVLDAGQNSLVAEELADVGTRVGAQPQVPARSETRSADGTVRGRERLAAVEEWIALQLMGLNTAELRIKRYMPVRIYLSETPGHAVTDVVKAVEGLALAINCEISSEFPAIRGSWFKKLVLVTKDFLTREDVTKRLEKLERAAELVLVGTPQANIDEKLAKSVTILVKALVAVPSAAIQVGSLLIIKHGGVLVVRNLTQRELIQLEADQSLLSSPSDLLEKLKSSDDVTRKISPPRRDRRNGVEAKPRKSVPSSETHVRRARSNERKQKAEKSLT